MTDLTTDDKAALAEALRDVFPYFDEITMGRSADRDAAAILAAMPGWTLVPTTGRAPKLDDIHGTPTFSEPPV